MKKSIPGFLLAVMALLLATPAMALVFPFTYSNVNGYGTYGNLQLTDLGGGTIQVAANYNASFFGDQTGNTSFGVQDVYLNLKSSYTGTLDLNGLSTWFLQGPTKPDGLGYFTLNATSGTNAADTRIPIDTSASGTFTPLFTLTGTGLTENDFLAYSKNKNGTDTQWMAAMHLAGYPANPAGSNNTSSYLATSVPVPIPSAVWLLGSGVIGLIGLKRRGIKRNENGRV